MKKDNTTIHRKVRIRKELLREIVNPVIMETHGGFGKVYRACYASIPHGIVFEKDEKKASVLAMQRPTWAVYACDAVNAITYGAGGHMHVTILDVDSYGDPWPTIQAFFTSTRPRAAQLGVVVNDGLRQKVRMGGAWSATSLHRAVGVFGNDMFDHYLAVCEWLLIDHAKAAGYTIRRFGGYYCGAMDNMTHYAAVFDRTE